MIDGAFVVENGRMRTIDEDAEIKRANRCAQLLCQRLEATGWEKDMPLGRLDAGGILLSGTELEYSERQAVGGSGARHGCI